MSASLASQSLHELPDLFEDLHDTGWALMAHAQILQDYSDLKDLEGLLYVLRCMDAALQRAVTLYNQAAATAIAEREGGQCVR